MTLGTRASQTATAAVFLLLTAGCSAAVAPVPTASSDVGLSLSSASNEVYKCLTDKGWTPTLTWDGGIEVDSETVPEAQWDLYDADVDECWAVIDNRVAQMQPDAISDIYASELDTRDCLVARKIDVGVPPSEQEYIDTFHAVRWSAYGDSNVQSLPEDEWRATNEACPQPAWSLGAP